MALTVKQTGSAEYGTYAKVLVVGDTGSGKTRFGRTWPHPFYANCEGGLMSVARDHLPYADIKTSAELLELVQTLGQAPDVRAKMLGCPVETVIVDTFDEVQRLLVRERLKETRKDAMVIADWGWLGDQLRSIVRAVRNLDMNVILTCHVKSDSDEETGRVTYRPAVQGAMGGEIAGYVDLAVLLTARPITRVEKGESVRRLVRVMQTFPDLNHPWIKDRSGQLPMEFDINFNDDYPRLHRFVFGDSADLWKAEVAKAQAGTEQLARDLSEPISTTPASEAPVVEPEVLPVEDPPLVPLADAKAEKPAKKAAKKAAPPTPVAARAGTVLDHRFTEEIKVDRDGKMVVTGLLDTKQSVYQFGGDPGNLVLWKDKLLGLGVEEWAAVKGVRSLEFVDSTKNEVWVADMALAKEHKRNYDAGAGPRVGIPIEIFDIYDAQGASIRVANLDFLVPDVKPARVTVEPLIAEPLVEVGAQPEVTVAPPPPLTSEPEDNPLDPLPPAKADPMVCEACGEAIKTQDQSDMSWIRFHKHLCKPCFDLKKVKR